jgi:CheY-like chemotaxis protein
MIAYVPKPRLSPNQTATILRVQPVTVRAGAQSSQPPALTTPGGRRRFRPKDISRSAAARGAALEAGERLDITPKVLVVDDERPVANYLAEFLNAHGALTAIAYNGFDVGRLVHTFAPDFILLDLIMPGLDGFEVCAQVKADPVTHNIHIVAMTGVYTRENSLRAAAAGAEHCLPKPLDHERLLQILGLPAQPPAGDEAAPPG